MSLIYKTVNLDIKSKRRTGKAKKDYGYKATLYF